MESDMKLTDAQRCQRNEFAGALERAATLADTVPCGGWDVPAQHIALQCRQWAKWYRVPGVKAKNSAETTVPARLALNLCRSIGDGDKDAQKAAVRDLAKWLGENGKGDLADYAKVQIGDLPAFVPM